MARELFPDWEVMTRGCVARLRALAGTDPDASDLAELVDERLLKSSEFTQLWESYDVRAFTQGNKTMQHPEVGALTLRYQSLLIEGTPGHRLVTYYALPDTPDYDAMVPPRPGRSRSWCDPRRGVPGRSSRALSQGHHGEEVHRQTPRAVVRPGGAGASAQPRKSARSPRPPGCCRPSPGCKHHSPHSFRAAGPSTASHRDSRTPAGSIFWQPNPILSTGGWPACEAYATVSTT
jgi:hypothetical protein